MNKNDLKLLTDIISDPIHPQHTAKTSCCMQNKTLMTKNRTVQFVRFFSFAEKGSITRKHINFNCQIIFLCTLSKTPGGVLKTRKKLKLF